MYHAVAAAVRDKLDGAVEVDGEPVPVHVAETQPGTPTIVVWPVDGGDRGEALLDGSSDQSDAPMRIHCHSSASAEQALWIAGRVHDALLDGELEVPGRHVQSVRAQANPGASPDPDEVPTVWTAAPMFRVRTDPA